MADNIYKIVKIPSEYEIVINAGKNKDVHIGDKFEIFSAGEEIFDPDTGESLGALDYVKDTVQAVTVLDKMSICKHLTSTLTSTFAALFAPSGKSVVEKLNVDYDDLSSYAKNLPLKIKVGDRVRLIERASVKENKQLMEAPNSDNTNI